MRFFRVTNQVMLHKLVITFESVDGTRVVYDHSMKAIDSCGTVYHAADGGSNFKSLWTLKVHHSKW